MTTRTNTGRHVAAAAAVLIGSLIGVSAVSAQAASETRWQPWLGCWTPAAAVGTTQTATVCVVPAGGTAVDLVTVTDGKVASRERIDASGERRDVTKDGCSGWEMASFAPGAARVYVRSELTCTAGVTRKTNGVLAFDANGQWLDVRGIAAGTQTGVRVIHYRDATDSLDLPAELANARSHHALDASTARIAATAPITLADIVDASSSLDARVVQAWLIEHGGQYKISASHLVKLAQQGVPGSVTDLLVALSYPQQFAVGLAMRDGAVRPATGQGDLADAGAREIPVYMWGGGFGSDYYGSSRYGYSPYGYGYSPYGYGYGNPYGWYGGGTPIVIVQRDPDATVGGRAVKGHGYTRSGGASTGGQATPRSSWSGRDGSSGSASQSGGSTTSATSGSGSSSSTARKAQPRKP